MDINTYNKITQPKTIDTVNFNGRYVDASSFKSRIATISTTSAIILAVIAYAISLFIT